MFFLLPLGLAVEVEGDACEQDVWHPGGYHGRPVAVDGEGGGDGLQHDVAGRECQPDAECAAHASLALAEAEAEADGREDEGREGVGKALVVLDLEYLEVARAAQLLAFDVFEQLAVGERLLLVHDDCEVARLHDDDAVDIAFGGDLLAQALEGAYLHVGEFPVEAFVGQRVVLDALGREVADEALVLELVE